MTKSELEQAYKRLEAKYDKLTIGLISVRLFLDNNLELFRAGLVDEDDKYNTGVKEVLVMFAKLWNRNFDLLKVELPHEFGGKIIQFPKKED